MIMNKFLAVEKFLTVKNSFVESFGRFILKNKKRGEAVKDPFVKSFGRFILKKKKKRE